MIREELKPIHHELKEINRRLDTLDEEYKNLKGITKEIDEIREEVHEIQKHLGIEREDRGLTGLRVRPRRLCTEHALRREWSEPTRGREVSYRSRCGPTAVPVGKRKIPT